MYFYIIIQRFNFVVSRIPEVKGDEFIVDKHEIEVFYESKGKFPTLSNIECKKETDFVWCIQVVTNKSGSKNWHFDIQVFCLNSGQRHNITVKTTET